MNIFISRGEHFKKAFLHLDGDSFFAACEIALNPKLKGKPVVTGLERGIASSMSYEAKARGITRGMRLFEMRKICPDVIILPSDYETYSIFAERMYNIVRRYAPIVEEYSIDECFADITDVVRRMYTKGKKTKDIIELAKNIKDDLYKELGVTFSLGIGPTKVLAKVASKLNKPNGLTVILPREVDDYLQGVAIEKVWGIGASTAVKLQKEGIRTAFDFVQKSEAWVNEHLNKPHVELWNELKGISVMGLNNLDGHVYKSISKTQTFTPATADKSYVFSELTKNIEQACVRLRKYGLVTSRISYFIKTSDFRYQGMEVTLGRQANTPDIIINAVLKTFDSVFRSGTRYRSSGVTFMNLEPRLLPQQDIFYSSTKVEDMLEVYKKVDDISRRYGRQTVFLASSLQAMKHEDSDDRSYVRNSVICKNNRILSIPYMGEVR